MDKKEMEGSGAADESIGAAAASMKDEMSDLGISYVPASEGYVVGGIDHVDFIVPALSEPNEFSGANEDANIDPMGGTDEGGEASHSSVHDAIPITQPATEMRLGKSLAYMTPSSTAEKNHETQSYESKTEHTGRKMHVFRHASEMNITPAAAHVGGRAVKPELVDEEVARNIVSKKRRGHAPERSPSAEVDTDGHRHGVGLARGQNIAVDMTDGCHRGGSTFRAQHHKKGHDNVAKNAAMADRPATIAVSAQYSMGIQKKMLEIMAGQDQYPKAQARAHQYAGLDNAKGSPEVFPSDDRYPSNWDEHDQRLNTGKGGVNASPRLTSGLDAIQVPSSEENLTLEPTSSADDRETVCPGAVPAPGASLTVRPTSEGEESVGGTSEGLQAEVDVDGSTFALPTATYVVDDIVQADVVDPEANVPLEGQDEKRLKCYQRWPYLLAIFGFIIVGAVFITLGATGTFDEGEKAVDYPPQMNITANESCPNFHPATPQSPLRFCKDTTCWVQVGFDLEGTEPVGRFGKYVRFSNDGTRFVVSVGDEDHLGNNSGAVMVYDISNNDSFVQVGQTIRGLAPKDEIRGFLSQDGNRLALGAPYYSGDDGKKDRAGQVRIYELQSGNWSLLGTPLNGDREKDRFGYSVALNCNGSIVAVGATFHDKRRGEVRVFRYENKTRNGTWVLLGDHINSDADLKEKSGWDVKLSDTGTIVAIGAKNDDETGVSPGRIRVFQYSSGNWTQVGNDLMGENGGDDYGRFIAMSSDGRTVAGGAWLHDGANGTMIDSGHARVYRYYEVDNLWSQVGRDLDGDGPEDRLNKVSLSASGRRVAIFTGSQGVNSTPGYVRVYDLIDGDWQQVGGRLNGQSYDGNFGSHAALSASGDSIIVGSPDPKGDACYKGLVRVFRQQEV